MRGQANVLGAMILLTIIIILWSMVWMWVMPILDELRGILTHTRINELIDESLIIEDVWVYNGNCTIYIYNDGKIEATISAIYINHILTWKGEITLEVGQGINLTVKLPPDVTTIKVLKVVTLRGGEYYWGRE